MKKIGTLFLALFLLTTVSDLCALGRKDARTASTPMAQSRIITDLTGNEVELPANIERVLITSIWPLPAVYCYYMNSTEKLIGIPGVALSVAEGSIFFRLYPDIVKLETGFINGTTINIEEVVKLRPDVVFYTGERQDEYALLKNAGISAIGFTTAMKAGGDVAANVEDWFRQLEAIFGPSPRVEKLLAYNKRVYAGLEQKLSGIPPARKPKALIVFTHTASALQIAGTGHYSDYWINATGAVNAASVQGLQNVDMEQILAWAPDRIYLTNFSPIVPEDLLNNRMAGYDWSQVPAVRNGQVYKFPLGTYRSYAPSVESSVVLQWMSALNQPALFPGVNSDAETAAFYQEIYGYTMSASDLDAMLRPGAMRTQGH
jgi:iron complex transport system substrate-binding protein